MRNPAIGVASVNLRAMKLVFATNNAHKLQEARALLPQFEILSLADIGCTDELPEEQDTLRGNAIQKADYVFQKYGLDCFADDTGLEVNALNGAPGVYSARYAGPQRSAVDNMNKLLRALQGLSDRKAAFKTVIALYFKGEQICFEGSVEGMITDTFQGTSGFGYDPVFQPVGYQHTFGQMTEVEKNLQSHRGRALEKMVLFLSKC
jgi:XTP/dITP diphosphohydrolase